jgi:hypothetical protein
MNRARVVTGIVFVVVVILVAAPYAILRPTINTYAAGLLTGIPSGFLLSFLTYYWQTPSLVVDVAGSKYDGVSSGYWVHLAVRNRAWGFLGGGTAQDCRARVKFDGKPALYTKWKDRPNPLRPVVAPTSAPGQNMLVEVADATLYDQAKSQTFRPGDEQWLDVAFRPKDAPCETCYIAIPENFRATVLVPPPECALPVGPHPFSVVLEYQGGRRIRNGLRSSTWGEHRWILPLSTSFLGDIQFVPL